MPNRAFDRYLAVVFARLVVCCDIFPIGLGWTLGDPSRTTTPAYRPARLLLNPLPGDPARGWGSILLVLATLAAFAMLLGADHMVRWAFAALAGYWAFWTVLFAASALTEPHAGLASAGFAFMCLIGNVRPVFASSTFNPHDA